MHTTPASMLSKTRKPRTVTGRVARHLRAAVLGAIRGREREFFNPIRTSNTLEALMMMTCDHLSKQMLEPADFDNDQGEAAVHAIVLALWPMPEQRTLLVTPAWRRVVTSARQLQERVGMSKTVAWRADGSGDGSWQIL